MRIDRTERGLKEEMSIIQTSMYLYILKLDPVVN